MNVLAARKATAALPICSLLTPITFRIWRSVRTQDA